MGSRSLKKRICPWREPPYAKLAVSGTLCQTSWSFPGPCSPFQKGFHLIQQLYRWLCVAFIAASAKHLRANILQNKVIEIILTTQNNHLFL